MGQTCFVFFCFDVVGEFQLGMSEFPGKARSRAESDISVVCRMPTLSGYLC